MHLGRGWFCEARVRRPKGRQMAKDLAITGWRDARDVNARIGEALGAANVNIEGTFGSTRLGEVHVLVEDPAPARRALEEAGFEVAERNVVLRSMKVANRPGSWGLLSRRLAEAHVGVDFHYMATDTRIVVGVDDYDKAIAALQVMGG
jgi:hypothetical protein